MKIVRSPLRISLGGGGTDLPSWYSQHGGFLITGAINKYIYFTGSERRFDKNFWISYSEVEAVDSAKKIKHDFIRQAMQGYDLPSGFEFHSISEIPGSSGLGSSGAFLVGALTVINAVKKLEVSRQEVAERACEIEMVELKKSSGKQDQYAAAFGGINGLHIDQSGQVKVEPIALEPPVLKELEGNMLIFFTGKSRAANKVLADQSARVQKKEKSTLQAMKRIQEIGHESKKLLLNSKLDDFGKLMHEHWQEKKKMSKDMSNSQLDDIYDQGMNSGALGGKIIGAGGGGYVLFYVPPSQHAAVRKSMSGLKLLELDWHFDNDGCSVIYSS